MLSQKSFDDVTDLFHRVSGIRLSSAKRPLVAGRLQKLAQAQGTSDLDDYVRRLVNSRDQAELVRVVDKLTTNETYFFREPQHFEHLKRYLQERKPGSGDFRVWSAASSSGEEAYSIAMLLADKLGLRGWQVVGTDLSTAMVASARKALYPLERAQHMPTGYLKRWCMKGQGEYEGYLLVNKELRANVHFQCANLTQPLPDIGSFDLIFLRNVLIYFDNEGKSGIVRNVLTRLAPQGWLFTGHAESINNLQLPVRPLASAVYAHA